MARKKERLRDQIDEIKAKLAEGATPSYSHGGPKRPLAEGATPSYSHGGPKRPANQSPTQTGSARRKKKRGYRFPGVQSNYDAGTRTNAAGQTFETFTRPNKPGMEYHEYFDADGNRRVVGVKRKPKRTGPPKGLVGPPKGL